MGNRLLCGCHYCSAVERQYMGNRFSAKEGSQSG